MHAAHYSSLLPDLFRHKTTKVRVFHPQVVLLDFHGTISERRWEDKVIFPYVKRTVGRYLHDNWNLDIVQRCLPGLRNEAFEQRFRHKYEDAPIISDQVQDEDVNPNELAAQMGDFLLWQMNNKRETRETQIIERLVWQDGVRRNELLTPLYDDVMPCISSWHAKYNCNIHVISSIERETLKLFFEHTSEGNLDQYISGYVSSKKLGDKMMSDTYKDFSDKFSGLKTGTSTREESSNRKTNSQSPSSSPSNDGKSKSRSRSLRAPSDILMKPILFLTDSGQEAKAANQVQDGRVYECLLVNRPGNKRIRSYYLSQFQYIESFNDIEFVK